jgi:hypothetical protein
MDCVVLCQRCSWILHVHMSEAVCLGSSQLTFMFNKMSVEVKVADTRLTHALSGCYVML